MLSRSYLSPIECYRFGFSDKVVEPKDKMEPLKNELRLDQEDIRSSEVTKNFIELLEAAKGAMLAEYCVTS